MSRRDSECPGCGKPMETAPENYHYLSCGLEWITLVGVKVSRCRGCGQHVVAIPKLEGLHREITLALVKKPGPLDPREIRFMRKQMDLTSVALAQIMGVAFETVSRWENLTAPQAIGPAAERLLRLIAFTHRSRSAAAFRWLEQVAKGPPGPLHLRLELLDDKWTVRTGP